MLQDAHRRARREKGLTVVRLIKPGHDPEQAGLAGSVRPDYADLRAGVEREGNAVKDDLVAVGLAHRFHGVDELRHGRDRRGAGWTQQAGRQPTTCRSWSGRRGNQRTGRVGKIGYARLVAMLGIFSLRVGLVT